MGLNKKNRVIKRWFDLFFALIGLCVIGLPVFILILMSTISTRKFGLYSQTRIGLNGEPFVMYKIRSMEEGNEETAVTLESDPRITRFGRMIRRYKLDELPQLWNVLIGDMSLVGPRPDVAGYADMLKGEDQLILSVRPGITGPATLKYKNEDQILAGQEDPILFNDQVIWKDKVEINKKYIRNWSLKGDIKYIIRTLFD